MTTLPKDSFDDDRYPIEDLLKRIENQQSPTILTGCKGAFAACVLSDVSLRTERPVFVLHHSEKEAETLVNNLHLFALPQDLAEYEEELEDIEISDLEIRDEIVHFPAYDVGPYHGASPDRKLTMQRLSALHSMSKLAPPRYMVTSARAATRKTLPKTELLSFSKTWSIGADLPNDRLRYYLSLCGYSEVDVVSDAGTFAVRGDLIDIFSPAHRNPFRIERWGNEISEIHSFDPFTQRRLGASNDVHVFPVREEVLSRENIDRAKRKTHELILASELKSIDALNAIDDLEAGIHFIGIDAILPAIYDHLSSIFAYVPSNAIIVVIEPEKVIEEFRAIQEQRATEYERIALPEKMLAYPPIHYYENADDVLHWLNRSKIRLDLERLHLTTSLEEEPGSSVISKSQDPPIEFRARNNADIVQIQKQHHVVEQTLREVSNLLKNMMISYGRICVTCRTQGQVERLQQLLDANGIHSFAMPTPIDFTEPLPTPCTGIEIYKADLTDGFRSQYLSVAVVSGREIFGQRVATKPTKSISEHLEISHFRDLNIGDHLVHVDFGIGRYLGLKRLEIGNIANDFLHIEYAGADKLYLPVYRLGRVQKYIGAASGVRLDKLGGTSWERTKEKVKEQIQEIAADLLKLYAKRKLQKGHAFQPPDDFYRTFEDAFPYEETPDQAQAIEDTLSDMTEVRPMDRLVCGDVGFGKTEVAIRAAMKAVVDGFQVAVLVPTTILCEQHVLSFRKRLEPFGIRVEGLSRFRSSKATRTILNDTEEGKVDVLIGTHRLLSEKLAYKKLGLLIIDEEQRFGVKHKDRIKEFKTDIDVLTLSATPIPRTLQMSMLGIRDLSIIATPPHDRLSVRTHVARFNDALIKEAIYREIGRGGQVFFIHNRVETIREMAEHIESIVPEARIAVAHGQMPEAPLEEVMLSYIKGQVNVLVSTSIVESGLDIPNANTIIVNRADMFGLSQLYQMRGRVGRGKERAFAYFLIPGNKKIGADAEKRLEILQTYTELGSGFQVASYDLEIRGAGSLLGENQSGHVASVGLDLYTELLEEAVNELRGVANQGSIEPEVNMPVESFIPEDYIPATSLRLMFYKRFSLSSSADEIYDTYSEMLDRFGEAPISVRNLRDIVLLQMSLRQLRAIKLDAGPSAISIELDATTPLNPAVVLEYITKTNGKIRLTDSMKLLFSLNVKEAANPLKTARLWVQDLLDLLEPRNH